MVTSMFLHRRLRALTLGLPALALAACASHPAPEQMSQRNAYAHPPENTSGSIFQAGYDVAYFEDLKARRVGDIVTILLRENTNASKCSNTKTKKDSDTTITPPIIAVRPVTVNGTEVLDNSLSAQRE